MLPTYPLALALAAEWEWLVRAAPLAHAGGAPSPGGCARWACCANEQRRLCPWQLHICNKRPCC